MENVNSIEDEFHIKLSEPVDLEELCKTDSKGSEFEVVLPEGKQNLSYDLVKFCFTVFTMILDVEGLISLSVVHFRFCPT